MNKTLSKSWIHVPIMHTLFYMILNLIRKFNIQQTQYFLLSLSKLIHTLRSFLNFKSNNGIIKPILDQKNQEIQVFRTKSTTMKTCENARNRKYSLCLNLTTKYALNHSSYAIARNCPSCFDHQKRGFFASPKSTSNVQKHDNFHQTCIHTYNLQMS